MRNRVSVVFYALLPSIFYLIEASGLLGNTGSGFKFNFGHLAASWLFALFAAPLYVLSGYPPAWAWIASGIYLLWRKSNGPYKRISAWMLVVTSLAYFWVSIMWVIRSNAEMFSWTRILLSLVTWPLVINFMGKATRRKTSSK